jgi:hypothetical protein
VPAAIPQSPRPPPPSGYAGPARRPRAEKAAFTGRDKGAARSLPGRGKPHSPFPPDPLPARGRFAPRKVHPVRNGALRALTPHGRRPSPPQAQRHRADARGAKTEHSGHYLSAGESQRRPDRPSSPRPAASQVRTPQRAPHKAWSTAEEDRPSCPTAARPSKPAGAPPRPRREPTATRHFPSIPCLPTPCSAAACGSRRRPLRRESPLAHRERSRRRPNGNRISRPPGQRPA